MTGQQLKNSILREAIQGRLVKQNPEDEPASILFESIQQAKNRWINEGRIKKDRVNTAISEEEIPFSIPGSWKWVRIQDLFNVRSALRIHQTDWQSEGIPFFRGRELVQLANTGHTNPEVFISRELYERNKAKGGVPQKNDVLISAVGTIGRVYIVQGTKEFYYKDAYILCLENYANTYVDYIKYALESPYLQEEIHRDSMATTVAQLTIIKAKSLLIPLPPISEQKRIVQRIEELFPLVEEYEKAAEELKALNEVLPDKLRKSVLQEAIHGNLVPNDIPDGEATAPELLQQILIERENRENKEKGKKAKKLTLSTIEDEPWDLPEGWCWCKLKDIIDFTSSGTTKNGEIASDSWILDLEDIEKDTGKLLRKKRFGEVKSLSDKRAFKTGNVLYSKLRPYLNKCIIANEDGFCTTEILAFDFGPVYNRYAQSFLMSPYFVDRVNQGAAGVKMPRVNNAEANDTCFPLPPLSIQHRIVEKIEEVFAAIDKLQA